jgi:transposase
MKRSVGVDLHKSSFTVCYLTGKEEPILQTFPVSLEGFAAFRQTLRKSDEVAVESTGTTDYFVRQVEVQVKRVRVVNPSQFKVIAQSVKKTDRQDAITLARYLQKGLIPEVRQRSKESQQLHRLLGTRDKVVKLRTILKNKLHALLSANGIVTKRELFSSEKGLTSILSLDLDAADRFELELMVEQIRSLTQTIAKIDAEVRTRGRQLPGHQNLTSITGIGDTTATIMLNTIGPVTDFENEKKIVAYFGMAPRVAQSNETTHYGHITKQGNKLARTALVQSTLIAIKYNRYLWSFYQRIKAKKGSGKAIIATARKLLIIIYRTLKNNWVFADFNEFRLA